MLCPICDIEMRIAERYGVEIDYCPQCRGVWLDRGELEKIIACLESQQFHGQANRDKYEEDGFDLLEKKNLGRFGDNPSRRDDDWHREGDRRRATRRKESLLSNLLDMFGD